jgi:AcrR family transcriptional regulator
MTEAATTATGRASNIPGLVGGLSRIPQQPRAVATVNKILAAATQILVEEDYSALNTNLVAKRAGVNVATLYTYFPDKLALVAELAVRLEVRRSEWVMDRATIRGESWRDWITDVVDAVAEARRTTYGGVAVRQAVMGVAELRYIDEVTTDAVVEAQIDLLMSYGPRLTRAKARRVSRLISETTSAVLDTAFRERPYKRSMIEDLKEMLVAYLALHLD